MINLKHSLRSVALIILAGIASAIQAGEAVMVCHQANEQNIITLRKVSNRFLLLPVQDASPEGRLYVVSGKALYREEGINVRLARGSVDYFVPLDLSAYRGKDVRIDVQGVPEDAVCWKKLELSDTFDISNKEKFRPVYHHTPAYGWMNDPNGMFYKDGVYHLYFQHNPYGSTWGNMTWGHSTSTDLVHWHFEGDAIHPDAWGAIFSGSCVVDYDNTAGFGKGAVIAFYTSAKSGLGGDVQAQSMAYSLDNGKTFTKYQNNPILTSKARDFRDPKVFWYAPGKHWVMMLAVGQEMQIYSSTDLKKWKKESSFGARQGAHGGVWECPDLVELPVDGTKEKKWVLICNINPGGPFGGSATQYFVGTFDGKTFVNESPTVTKWMDWGKDNYATVTWNNVPGGRCIALGWMSNWQYQGVLPTVQYRGANTIARDLMLYRYKGDCFLKSTPVPELKKARDGQKSISSFRINQSPEMVALPEDAAGTFEMELALENQGAQKIYMTLQNDNKQQVSMWYDCMRKQFVMDRSESGKTDFSADFPAVTVAPIHDTKTIKLTLYVDRSSIEVFGEGGKYVMTNRVFPDNPYNRISFHVSDGSCMVKSLNIYGIR